MQQFSFRKSIKLFLFVFLLFSTGSVTAQIGIGIANPSASAQLDVSSVNKGFLPPRMTEAQRNAIVLPVAGLIVFCKDCGVLGELQIFNSYNWTNIIGGRVSPVIPPTVTIGTQVWMTKNLDVETYRNGDTIPQVKDAVQWANLTTGAWCYYNFDPINAVYGKLYNRSAVFDGRGLAPEGWHIPNNTEWNQLTDFLGERANGKLRPNILWNAPDVGATNESGFTALPGGFIGQPQIGTGVFEGLGVNGEWWSTSESIIVRDVLNYYFKLEPPFSPGLTLFQDEYITIGPDPEFPHVHHNLNTGLSVRCLKD